MNSSDFLTINDILADVLVYVGDEDYKNGITPGWYKRRTQVAMDELAITSFINTEYVDKPMPASKEDEIPSGLISVKNIIAYSGTLGDPQSQVPITYKDDMIKAVGANNYTSTRSETTGSNQYYEPISVASTAYFASRQGNKITFSQSCLSYQFYRITYTGFGSRLDELPIIPRMFREAITAYVTLDAITAMMSRDRTKAQLYAVWSPKKKDAWDDALFRAGKMDKWQRDSFGEYFRGLKLQYA